MKTKFIETLRHYSMLSAGDRVIVGLSGGADSMCLADLLYNSADELGIVVEAAHINHGIRGEEALRDEQFVADFCKSRGIRLYVLHADIPSEASKRKESIELCARKVRYDYFDSLVADKIATAHTGSDRIETMLMNISRGAGLNGLCSIPAVRGNIIRPLINFTRDEIEAYCRDNSIDFVTDSTNLSDDYCRNRFRHNVVAELKNINPSFEKNALRCIEIINRDNTELKTAAENILKARTDEAERLDVRNISEEKHNLHRLIVMYLDYMGINEYETKHIDYIIKNIGRSFSITLPGGKRIACNKDYLYVGDLYMAAVSADDFRYDICKGDSFTLNGVYHNYKLEWTDTVPENTDKCFVADADRIDECLTIRSRSSGDVIHLGKRRCSKTLNKLLNENKIPAEVRDRIVVVSDKNGVIFAEGCGIDSLREVTVNSNKFLIIRMEDINFG